jgi:hypothetical protein
VAIATFAKPGFDAPLRGYSTHSCPKGTKHTYV